MGRKSRLSRNTLKYSQHLALISSSWETESETPSPAQFIFGSRSLSLSLLGHLPFPSAVPPQAADLGHGDLCKECVFN
jgi:hypothetical protein